ncbi:MAG: hypothetical protein P1V97_01435, partial [Planctomycetota bacterium]|nr:hypothetical protein [Planctomycetota bacterium]
IERFEVDFKEYSILAVFQGSGTNQIPYSELSFRRIDDAVRARLKLKTFQSFSKTSNVSVYALAIIEKTDDEIIVEVGYTEGPSGENVLWQKVPVKSLKD